jgi:superfamily I DNA and RNA helicase
MSVPRARRLIDEITSEISGHEPRRLDRFLERSVVPHRFRGLAGTGKTWGLARKAAQLLAEHAGDKNWRIAFVYFTWSLKQQIKELIQRFYQQETGSAAVPWGQIDILSAWTFRNNYAKATGCASLKVADAEAAMRRAGNTAPYLTSGEKLSYICDLLADRFPQDSHQCYATILVDEGQDLPLSFFRIAYKRLQGGDKRLLHWAYDEAQGIDSLIIPRIDRVFDAARGMPDIARSVRTTILRECYRSPKELVVTAHAFSMGLRRRPTE